jgi:hypothetical protein
LSWVRRLLPLMAGLYTLAFVVCVTLRLPFQFETAWMESGLLAMTERVAAGRSIYAEPTTAYIPFIYPPLHFVLSAKLAAAVPALAGFVAMRVVSLASTLGTALLLGGLLARAGEPPRRMAVWLGLFLAFYGRFQGWHDSSRVDSLFALLIFAALAALIEGRGPRSGVVAGGLAGLAFLAKQPALPVFGAVALALAIWDRRWWRLGLATGAGVVTVVAGLAALGELGNRWFYYYVLEVPATHPLLAENFTSGLTFMVTVLPLFVLWVFLAARTDIKNPTFADRYEGMPARGWTLAFAVAAVVLLVLASKAGAARNFFLPLVPIGIVVVARNLTGLGLRDPLVLAQFLILIYNPAQVVPVAADWRAGYQFLADLRGIPGDVLLPQFPGYLEMTGKAPVAHGVALCDISALRPDLLAAMNAQLQRGRYAAAVDWIDPRHPGNCRARFSEDPRGRSPIPVGGDFFNSQHNQMAGVSRVDASPSLE